MGQEKSHRKDNQLEVDAPSSEENAELRTASPGKVSRTMRAAKPEVRASSVPGKQTLTEYLAASPEGAPADVAWALELVGQRAQAVADRAAAEVGLASAPLTLGEKGRARTRAASTRGVAEGGNIFLDDQSFDPDTADGRQLIAHEVAHLAQTKLSPAPVANPAAFAEADAARFAAAFAAGSRAELAFGTPAGYVGHEDGGGLELPTIETLEDVEASSISLSEDALREDFAENVEPLVAALLDEPSFAALAELLGAEGTVGENESLDPTNAEVAAGRDEILKALAETGAYRALLDARVRSLSSSDPVSTLALEEAWNETLLLAPCETTAELEALEQIAETISLEAVSAAWLDQSSFECFTRAESGFGGQLPVDPQSLFEDGHLGEPIDTEIPPVSPIEFSFLDLLHPESTPPQVFGPDLGKAFPATPGVDGLKDMGPESGARIEGAASYLDDFAAANATGQPLSSWQRFEIVCAAMRKEVWKGAWAGFITTGKDSLLLDTAGTFGDWALSSSLTKYFGLTGASKVPVIGSVLALGLDAKSVFYNGDYLAEFDAGLIDAVELGAAIGAALESEGLDDNDLRALAEMFSMLGNFCRIAAKIAGTLSAFLYIIAFACALTGIGVAFGAGMLTVAQICTALNVGLALQGLAFEALSTLFSALCAMAVPTDEFDTQLERTRAESAKFGKGIGDVAGDAAAGGAKKGVLAASKTKTAATLKDSITTAFEGARAKVGGAAPEPASGSGKAAASAEATRDADAHATERGKSTELLESADARAKGESEGKKASGDSEAPEGRLKKLERIAGAVAKLGVDITGIETVIQGVLAISDVKNKEAKSDFTKARHALTEALATQRAAGGTASDAADQRVAAADEQAKKARQDADAADTTAGEKLSARDAATQKRNEAKGALDAATRAQVTAQTAAETARGVAANKRRVAAGASAVARVAEAEANAASSAVGEATAGIEVARAEAERLRSSSQAAQLVRQHQTAVAEAARARQLAAQSSMDASIARREVPLENARAAAQRIEDIDAAAAVADDAGRQVRAQFERARGETASIESEIAHVSETITTTVEQLKEARGAGEPAATTADLTVELVDAAIARDQHLATLAEAAANVEAAQNEAIEIRGLREELAQRRAEEEAALRDAIALLDREDAAIEEASRQLESARVEAERAEAAAVTAAEDAAAASAQIPGAVAAIERANAAAMEATVRLDRANEANREARQALTQAEADRDAAVEALAAAERDAPEKIEQATQRRAEAQGVLDETTAALEAATATYEKASATASTLNSALREAEAAVASAEQVARAAAKESSGAKESVQREQAKAFELTSETFTHLLSTPSSGSTHGSGPGSVWGELAEPGTVTELLDCYLVALPRAARDLAVGVGLLKVELDSSATAADAASANQSVTDPHQDVIDSMGAQIADALVLESADRPDLLLDLVKKPSVDAPAVAAAGQAVGPAYEDSLAAFVAAEQARAAEDHANAELSDLESAAATIAVLDGTAGAIGDAVSAGQDRTTAAAEKITKGDEAVAKAKAKGPPSGAQAAFQDATLMIAEKANLLEGAPDIKLPQSDPDAAAGHLDKISIAKEKNTEQRQVLEVQAADVAAAREDNAETAASVEARVKGATSERDALAKMKDDSLAEAAAKRESAEAKAAEFNRGHAELERWTDDVEEKKKRIPEGVSEK